MSIESFVGSKISITTHNELRYEGLFFNLDTNDSSIVLQNVRCMGTEWRGKNGEVPASNTVHDFIVFKADDIKDISVAEVQQEPKPPVHPYGYPDVNNPYGTNPFDPMAPRGLGAPTHGTGYDPLGPPGMHGMVNNPFTSKMNQQMPISPYSNDAQSFFRGAPAPSMSMHTPHMMPSPPINPKPPGNVYNMFMDPLRQPQINPRDGPDKFTLDEFDFGADPFAESNLASKTTERPTASFYGKGNDYKLEQGQRLAKEMSDLPDMMSSLELSSQQAGVQQQPYQQPQMPAKQRTEPSQPISEAPKAANKPRQRGRNSPKRNPEAHQKVAESIKTEGEVAQMQEKTVKEVSVQTQKPKELQPTKAKTADRPILQPFYDKKSSFFDNLSHERETSRMSQREERQKQRELDVDTFGEESVRSNNQARGARRGRGDRRRFGGRGRGNGNYNQYGGRPKSEKQDKRKEAKEGKGEKETKLPKEGRTEVKKEDREVKQ